MSEDKEEKPKKKISNWKNFERKVARLMCGRRIVRPDWGTEDLDVIAEPFGIECKYRKVLSYDKALEQVERIILTKPERKGLLPLAVVQKPGTVSKEDVIFRLGLLRHVGVLSDTAGEELQDIIVSMPLKTFKEILDKKGFKYGYDIVEGGGEQSD